METPGAGCPCSCKRRSLGRLQRHGPGPQSAARPGNFQKLPGPERRANGSGPRLSAEALRSRGGRLAAALRFPEAWAGRWDARPRRGAGAARGRRGPLWEGFSAFLGRPGGFAPRICRETWRPPLAEFSRAARTARSVGHTLGLRALPCPDRGCFFVLSKCLPLIAPYLPAFWGVGWGEPYCIAFFFTASFLLQPLPRFLHLLPHPNPQCDIRCLEAAGLAPSEVTRESVLTLSLSVLFNSAVLSPGLSASAVQPRHLIDLQKIRLWERHPWQSTGPLKLPVHCGESPAGAGTTLSVHQVQNPPLGRAACSLRFPCVNSKLIYSFDFLKDSHVVARKPNVTVFRDKSLYEGHVRTQQEGNHLQTRKRDFTRNQPCQHLDLGL
nr:uncharacterized protein LOC110150822 [Odocoileus virginianus texanus]